MEQDTRDILRIMDVDYGGVVNVCKATLPGMLERGSGDLINFASIAGWSPSLHFGAYNAAKFAVVAFSEVLYHENRDRGVRFCIVCPPPVDTPLLDQAKSQPKVLKEKSLAPIQPDEVLDAIERDLVRGRLFCFPNRQTHLAQVMRRFVPSLVWAGIHRIEGR
jgi:short-subunit dehydrogenase